MSEQLKRAEILKKRLALLNEYIQKESEANKGVTFAAFLRSKGITHSVFIKDLPPRFKSVPAKGLENIAEYTAAMASLLENQLELHADATYSIVGDDGEDEENFNCCGSADGGEASEMLNCSGCENNCNSGTDDSYNAIGSICIKPIAPIISKKLAPGMWRSYENKKKSYEKCKAIQAENKAAGKKKSLHILNLSNAGLAVARVSFLKLVAYNIFGLGQIFEMMRKDADQTAWKKINALWYNWGGNESKLDSNISIGHNKKPIFRAKGWKPKGVVSGADGQGWVYGSDPYTTAAIISAASTITTSMIAVINNYLKSKGKAPVEAEGAEDKSFEGDPNTPEIDNTGADLSEGMSIPVKIGIGVGIAVVVGGLIWGISKVIK